MAKVPDLKKLWLIVDQVRRRVVVVIADSRDEADAIYRNSACVDTTCWIDIRSMNEMAREAVDAKARNGSKFAIFNVVSW
jgi:hypothetical protein